MRTSDFRFSSIHDSSNVRFPIQYFPFPSQNQNIYYQTPMALHLTPNQIQNGSHLNNNVIFPPIYQLGNQQLMLNGNPHLVLAVPCAATNNLAENNNNNNISNQSSVESHLNQSIISPNTLVSSSNQLSINFSLSKWNEVAPFFDESNNEIRPSAGQLKNGKYFTQRSAGKDIYMVFNSKSDYINNFVNYYFSNKNFSTDDKLYKLMDDCGCVALSDLMKFPRLAQIGTTIDDIIEALKFSNFVIIVNMKNETKGIRRLDGWFPSKLVEESQVSVTSQWTSTMNNNESSASFHKANPDVYRHKLNTNNNSMNIIIPSNHNMHESNVVTIQSPHDIKSQMVDTAVSNNQMIYFNSPNNPIQQSIYAPAYVHGIHQNNFPSTGSHTTATPMLAQGHAPQLILNTPQHYSNSTIFQPNQSIQLRPLWQNQNLTDLNNHMLYNSGNNNIRQVIGAGGTNQTNQKQCPY